MLIHGRTESHFEITLRNKLFSTCQYLNVTIFKVKKKELHLKPKWSMFCVFSKRYRHFYFLKKIKISRIKLSEKLKGILKLQ